MKDKKDLKYLFIGGTQSGYKLLKAVISDDFHPSYAFILKEDKHEKEKYSQKISKMLSKRGVSFELRKALSSEDLGFISRSGFDFVIVYGWRSMIKLDFNKSGLPLFAGIHNSLLPKYRGFAPLQWAVINGEKYSGITMFRIGNGDVDSGDIIRQKKIKIGDDEFIQEINSKFTEAAIKLFTEFINLYLKEELRFRKQREKDATYTCKRIPEDSKIDWTKSSTEIFNLIRATADSQHSAYCAYKGKRYYIFEAAQGKFNNKKFSGRICGRVYRINDEGIEVICGSGTLLIKKWCKINSGNIVTPSLEIKSIKETLS